MKRAEWNDFPIPERIGVPTALGVSVLGGVAYWVVRALHRAEMIGLENLPEGPYVLVGNHPPSMGMGEFFSFMCVWARKFGGTKPLAGVTHVAAHAIWPTNWGFRQIGAIPSTYAAMETSLARGVPIFILPGGDWEAFRAFYERGADFHGREGFLKIARKAGVPIVPVGFHGQSAPVVLRARFISYLFVWPKLIGVKRFGLTAFALFGAIAIAVAGPHAWYWRLLMAYAWVVSPFSLLSWLPTKVRIRIGKPMSNESTTADVEKAISALM